MNMRWFFNLCRENFLFWLSRKIDFPLVPPDMVQVNFSFRCNLSCSMCNMKNQMQLLKSKGKRTEIDSDTFYKIIRESKELGAKAVLFIGGEPFLREDIFELVAYAKRLKLTAVIITNGILLNDEIISRCLDGGVDWLSVSLDAASEHTLRLIRGAAILEKVTGNIRNLNRRKKAEKKEYPKLVAVCTIMRHNLEELSAVVRLSRELGVSRIIFQPVVINNADQGDRSFDSDVFIPRERFPVLDREIDALSAFKKSSAENFKYIANSCRQLELIKQYFRGNLRGAGLPCYAGYNRLQITQDYVVYFCRPLRHKLDISFGDVSKDSLRALWYSREAYARRRLIRKCDAPCLQWCMYRDEFVDFAEAFQQRRLFPRG